MSMKLGFNMAGTEEKFEEMLAIGLGSRTTYLEIGVAAGGTILSVADYCNINLPMWSCIGVDVERGGYFNPAVFLLGSSHWTSIHNGHARRPLNEFLKINGITIALCGSSNIIVPGFQFIGFCLIDGCHGKKCVIADFEKVELVIIPGGIVAFHDACEEDQGFGFQPHCGEPINVRAALKSLGLLDNSREGWESLGEAHGDKSKQGNGFAFFRKI